jgi:nitrogen PTS system EIIA component
MDLKIKDVAELLNVSETTIRRWLSSGQIPAYRLNHQYRFSRFEIENWMMSCKLKQEKGFSSDQEKDSKETEFELPLVGSKMGTQQFSLFRALNQGDVFINVPGNTKEEVIQNGAKKASTILNLDADLVTELLLDREKLMSTALNNGVAVPHPREFIVQEQIDRIILVFPEKPIDFGALDEQPVYALFFLFSSQDKRHLHLLAKIAHFSNDQKALSFLAKKPDKESLLAFVKEWEGHVKS